MTRQEFALVVAGLIGSIVALFHGGLLHRYAVRQLNSAAIKQTGLSSVMRRLLGPLLQFTTFNWFVGGLALVAVAFWGTAREQAVVGLLVGSAYLYGAVGNGWATRLRHPGWALYAIAVALIGFAITTHA